MRRFARQSRAVLSGCAVLAALLLCASAQAHDRAGYALLSAAQTLTAPAPASCPAGVPVQPITVVNQAHASRYALAKVERAMVDQSMQLRAAWGTPCVRFAPGGWPVYLRIGGTEEGVHYAAPTRAIVDTAGLPMLDWSSALSHEVVEMLVDPGGVGYYLDGEITQLEIADPVDERGYRLDGMWVSDFALPAYFAGASWVTDETYTDIVCAATCTNNAPQIAPAFATGPYDQAGILRRPWDTTWERS